LVTWLLLTHEDGAAVAALSPPAISPWFLGVAALAPTSCPFLLAEDEVIAPNPVVDLVPRRHDDGPEYDVTGLRQNRPRASHNYLRE
jgi:hypothetical protein